MTITQLKFTGVALAVATLAAALGGCAGGANQYVQDSPAAGSPILARPLPHQALADEVYLDGTGVSARRMAGAPDTNVETVRVTPPSPDGPQHAVVRSRPTAIRGRTIIRPAPPQGHGTRPRPTPTSPLPPNGWRRRRRTTNGSAAG